MANKIFMALLVVMVIISSALAVMFLIETVNENAEKKALEANGFYLISYHDAYNLVKNDSSCTDFYQGIVLKDGDKVIKARILSQVKCSDCERNRNTSMPADGTRVTVDLNDDGKEGILMYNGKMIDLYDVIIVQ
jgi:hypothetical protein